MSPQKILFRLGYAPIITQGTKWAVDKNQAWKIQASFLWWNPCVVM